MRSTLLYALSLYLIALVIRLPGIRTAEPGPDEFHWLSRSAQVVKKLQEGNYRSVTTHLGHPGLPPAVMMATAQVFGKWFSETTGSTDGDRFFLDNLSSARIANAIVSSAVVPVVFVSGALAFSAPIGTLAALLLAFDPQHIALSRVAHIDGVLTLLVTLCAVAFFWADRNNNGTGRVVGGGLWGLSLLTKPTAIALIPVLGLYRLLRALWLRVTPLLTWSDIWGVVAAHAVMVVLWTKLHDPNHNFIKIHHVNPRLAKRIGAFGRALDAHPWVTYGILLLATVSIISLVRHLFRRDLDRALSQTTGWKRAAVHLSNVGALVGVVTLVASLEPLILQNIVRYWGWVLGLSDVKHEAYGQFSEMPGVGYPEIWFRRLPMITGMGFLCGFCIALRGLFKGRVVAQVEERILLAVLAVGPVLWTVPLHSADKQTIRYVLPSYPAVVLVSAVGFAWIYDHISKWMNVGMLQRRFVRSSILIVPGMLQAYATFLWAPHFQDYMNRYFGGLHAARERGFSLSPSSFYPALDHIQAQANEYGITPRVEVVGDPDLVAFAYRRAYAHHRNSIEFLPYLGEGETDWLLFFSGQQPLDQLGRFNYAPRLKRAMESKLREEEVWVLYEVLPPNYTEPLTIDIHQTHRATGSINTVRGLGKLLFLDSTRHEEGWAHFGQSIRGGEGHYTVRQPVKLEPIQQDGPAQFPVQPALRIEFGLSCIREVYTEELRAHEFVPVEIDCEFKEDFRSPLRLYWYGSTSLVLGDIEVRRNG